MNKNSDMSVFSSGQYYHHNYCITISTGRGRGVSDPSNQTLYRIEVSRHVVCVCVGGGLGERGGGCMCVWVRVDLGRGEG